MPRLASHTAVRRAEAASGTSEKEGKWFTSTMKCMPARGHTCSVEVHDSCVWKHNQLKRAKLEAPVPDSTSTSNPKTVSRSSCCTSAAAWCINAQSSGNVRCLPAVLHAAESLHLPTSPADVSTVRRQSKPMMGAKRGVTSGVRRHALAVKDKSSWLT